MFYGDYSGFNPRYDLFHRDYEIQRYYGNFGIVRFRQLSEDDETAPLLSWVVEPEYDSIFRLEDIFVLSRDGRVGAVRCVDDTYEWVAPCKYHAVDSAGGGIIFTNYDETRCYFQKTHGIRTFSKVYFEGPDGRYLFAVDTKAYYIIDSFTDVVLWSCAKEDPHLSPYMIFGEDPCLVYMGTVDDLPMFFDFINSNYIVPIGEHQLGLMPDFPNVIVPIIVRDNNIVTIVDDYHGKLYAGTFEECVQGFDESEGFDEATVELKVTLKREAGTEERCYPLPHGTFHPGDIVDYFDWHHDIRP